jgi:hypothetical protein
MKHKDNIDKLDCMVSGEERLEEEFEDVNYVFYPFNMGFPVVLTGDDNKVSPIYISSVKTPEPICLIHDVVANAAYKVQHFLKNKHAKNEILTGAINNLLESDCSICFHTDLFEQVFDVNTRTLFIAHDSYGGALKLAEKYQIRYYDDSVFDVLFSASLDISSKRFRGVSGIEHKSSYVDYAKKSTLLIYIKDGSNDMFLSTVLFNDVDTEFSDWLYLFSYLIYKRLKKSVDLENITKKTVVKGLNLNDPHEKNIESLFDALVCGSLSTHAEIAISRSLIKYSDDRIASNSLRILKLIKESFILLDKKIALIYSILLGQLGFETVLSIYKEERSIKEQHVFTNDDLIKVSNNEGSLLPDHVLSAILEYNKKRHKYIDDWERIVSFLNELHKLKEPAFIDQTEMRW